MASQSNKRNRYALLSDEQRELYIPNTIDARKKRRTIANNSLAKGENNDQTYATSEKRQKPRWLLRAQLVEYKFKGL